MSAASRGGMIGAIAWVMGVGVAGTAWAQVRGEPIRTPAGPVETVNPSEDTMVAGAGRAGRWGAGGGLGFLGETPDGTAVALGGFADYFASEQVSLGPLLQVGFTGDLTMVGLSGQAKYRVGMPDPRSPTALVLQAGLGFMHADLHDADTAWLVPIGVGLEHRLTDGMDLVVTALVDFTDLKTGRGTEADVMPGFTAGLRF